MNKLSSTDKYLITHALALRISYLEEQLVKWDAIPDGTLVSNLDKYFIAKAREDIPNIQRIIQDFTK